ncbi:MAG: hypothetical protein LBT33_05730 [Spirochaetia bacterium]|jgi:hypothetical protein|nr:hypothetical protein [Spirochaetia bacterium]
MASTGDINDAFSFWAYFCFVRLFQNPRNPWGARGWSQFCFAKLLLAHASRIAAEIPQDLHGKSEELQRKARFAAFRAANAPKFRMVK